MLRSLRIAVTVLSLVACVLFFALWVRSYAWLDRVDFPVGPLFPGRTATTASVRGLMMFGVQPEQYNVYAGRAGRWRVSSERIDHAWVEHIDRGTMGFKFIRGANEWGWQMPSWVAALMMAFCAGLPWIRSARRFSLRILLVVMSLVAGILGLIASSN